MKKLLGGLLIFTLCLPLTTNAQLTADDIEDLKKQAIEEGWTFEVTANPATEYPLEQLAGLVIPEGWEKDAKFNDIKSTRLLPDAFSWKDHEGGLPPARDQGGCGSCWAFSTIGALECNIAIRDGVIEDLSEQWLISCNSDGYDCGGGWMAHDYLLWKTDPCDSTGAVMEAEFPYIAANGYCACPYTHPYTIDGWGYVGSSVLALKEAIFTYGPISVGVAATNAMQTYGGGIFNACSSTDINHAVILVGWDDTVEGGIWIMRNSWGTDWGEDGYMRMPYGCNMVGYGAAYVDYYGGAYLIADTCWGWVPFDVQFTGISGLEVDLWTWDFGDGDSAYIQDPPHCFEIPGLYDVTLEVQAGAETRSRTRYSYIAALADTMYASEVQYDPEMTEVEVTIFARNNTAVREFRIPVEYSGSLDLVYDTFSTVGCRTEYFEDQNQINWVPAPSKLMTFKLVSSEYQSSDDLAPGVGPILKIRFHVNGTATVGQETPIVMDGYSTNFVPRFSGPMAVYTPEVRDGIVSFAGCCQDLTGNINGDPLDILDISDLVYLVDFMFSSGPALPCPEEANIDGDIWGQIDISDLVHLVTYMFSGGPPPAHCF